MGTPKPLGGMSHNLYGIHCVAPETLIFHPFHISHNMYAIVIRIRGFPRELVDESRARQMSSQGETGEAKQRATFH